MKKIFALAISAGILMAACNSSDNSNNAGSNEEKVPVESVNTAAFNTSFETLLNDYYQLKDALVATDTAATNAAAAKLIVSSDSLLLAELNDSTGAVVATAQDYAKTISSKSAAILSSADVEEKRKEFQIISDAMYDLVRTVRFDNQTIYHQYCPMAFDDKGAYWLSNVSEIRNPYFGKKMLACGEVKDSLGFR
ncbi:MAG TPA: DUF3347 domain-containing protein [Parasegetibacter sp.]